jgi:small-conductance mechanosensitive channel
MSPTQFFRQSWHGNSVESWGTAVGVAVGIVGVLLLARYLLVTRGGAIAARTRSDVDDFAVDLVRRTRYFFIIFLGAWVGAQFLDLEPSVERRFEQAAVLVFLLQSAIWGNGLVSFWVRRFTANRRAPEDAGSTTTIVATGYLVRMLLWTIILLVALENLGVNITALVAGLGITGIAVALAVQNVLGDLLAAVSIVLDRPFVIGDFISVEGVDGTVERIGIKTTRVRSLSGEQVILPNSELLKGRIRNFRRMDERRVAFTIGVIKDTPADKVGRIPAMLREMVESQPQTRFDRSHFASITETALEFETVYFVTSPDYGQYMDIQQAINIALLRRFADDGIELALPTRLVIHATRPDAMLSASPGLRG